MTAWPPVTIVKFADDTTVIGLITGDDETAYREGGGQSPDILVPGQQPPSQSCGGSTWTQGYFCSFYRCNIESILTGCITAWYSSCTALNHKALQRVVKAAQHITRTELLHPWRTSTPSDVEAL
ncbi:hypothetical protein L3Q82_001697 [Scortum barcoo]|uniref:Uncharacterized protein n=1 Tax=Scortum barcoo TaxID=214431 RepID=A0ACB8W582_9TELE|nr:hypothetical protein L3Q82_001697 [Scortum barcoo]